MQVLNFLLLKSLFHKYDLFIYSKLCHNSLGELDTRTFFYKIFIILYIQVKLTPVHDTWSDNALIPKLDLR